MGAQYRQALLSAPTPRQDGRRRGSIFERQEHGPKAMGPRRRTRRPSKSSHATAVFSFSAPRAPSRQAARLRPARTASPKQGLRASAPPERATSRLARCPSSRSRSRLRYLGGKLLLETLLPEFGIDLLEAVSGSNSAKRPTFLAGVARIDLSNSGTSVLSL
jgi:hypothetical protein